MIENNHVYSKKLKITWLCCWIMIAGLHILFLSNFFNNPNPKLALFILGVQVCPIWLIVPGLLKTKPRAYIWLCFLLIPYFLVATMQVFSSVANWTHQVFIALTVCLFVASMLCSRWLSQSLQQDSQS